jgi:anti-sigma B factor antagonist
MPQNYGKDRRRSKGPAFHVEAHVRDDGVAEVLLSGELDLATSPDLREAIDDVFGRDGVISLIVDLHEVGFMDSTGLAALLYAHERVRDRDGELFLRRPSAPVAHVLAMTKTDDVFTVRDDQD